MAQREPVWLKDGTGIHQYVPTAPTRWKGEAGCVVGPFSSQRVAEYFTHHVIETGGDATRPEAVFARGSSWYVKIEALES